MNLCNKIFPHAADIKVFSIPPQGPILRQIRPSKGDKIHHNENIEEKYKKRDKT